MQVLLLFPLAFIAGMDGFAIFAPYLMVIVLIGHLIQHRQRRQRAAAAGRDQLPAASGFNQPVAIPVRA